MTTERKTLMVCFLPSSSELLEKSILNTLAAKFAPALTNGREHPMVHAELFFPDYVVGDVVGGKSCGIHYGGNVFLSPKTFSRSTWEFRSISCTPSQYGKALSFCKSKVGNPFNYMGYYSPCALRPFDPRSNQSKKSWYCSELSAAALHYADILPDVGQSYTHPELLYQAVAEISYADSARNLLTSKLLL